MLALFLLSGTLALQKPPAAPVRAGEPSKAAIAADATVEARELARRGPGAIPELLARLAADDAAPVEARAQQEEALLGALASFGPEALRPALRKCLEAKPEASVRVAALRVLARVGTSADVGLARLALDDAGPGLEAPLQETCTSLLARDARSLEPVRRWLLQSPPGIDAALARALGASGCAGSLQALASTLGYRAELDPELLPEIARLVARGPMPVDEEILQPVEEALEEGDARVLREAALVLGHARHAAAVPPLIALLEHESRGVKNAAEWALERITGARFRGDPRRWAAWLARENAWYAERAERRRLELSRGDAVVVIRALGELSGHRWRAHEFAAAAAPALESADARVRRLACLTLARLGSTAAEGGLRHALEDEDESVSRAAQQALDQLGLGPAAAVTSPEAEANQDLPSRNPAQGPRSRPKRS